MWFDWLEKVPQFLQFSWAQLAQVFIGAFMVSFFALKWVKSIRRATKAQIEAEEHKLAAQLAAREAAFHGKVAELQVRCAEEKVELQKSQIELQQTCRQAEEDRERLQSELSKLQKQWNDLEAFDGKLWQRVNLAPPPAFLPAASRKTRFVAIMNLNCTFPDLVESRPREVGLDEEPDLPAGCG